MAKRKSARTVPGTLHPAEARRILEADLEKKRRVCHAEVNAVLERHGFQLAAVPGITNDGRVVARLAYVPKQ